MKNLKRITTLLVASLMILGSLTACGGNGSESGNSQLNGNITLNGSTSMNKLANALREGFMTANPGVMVNVEFTGSGTGIQAAIDGTTDIGNSSRALKEEEINKFLSQKQVIVFGIETHICVLQTAMDLLNEGYEVFVVQNACGSRDEANKQAALRRLIHAGAQIVTTEMVLFELLEGSKHPNFKEVQALIK